MPYPVAAARGTIRSPEPYYRHVLSVRPANLAGYWRLNETSGANAADSSGNGKTGTYANVTLGQSGIGDGSTVPLFVAASLSTVTLPTTIAFSPLVGSLMVWGKISAATVWSDAVHRVLGTIYINDNNRVYILKNATANILSARYVAGGTTSQRDNTSFSSMNWFQAVVTWDKASDRVRFYVNGAQVGADVTGLGVWVGVPWRINIGSQAASGNYWSGWAGHSAIWNAELTAEEVLSLYSAVPRVRCVAFGDSITSGTGATIVPYRWANLLAAASEWTMTNSGIAATVLQNTAQTTIAPPGALANNGRDTYTTRVAAYGPDVVIILYGLNDLRLNDAAFSDALYANDLGETVDGLIAAGVRADRIVLGSPPYIPAASYALDPPWDGGTALKHAAYVAATAAVATTKGTKYVNIYQYMLENGGDALIGGDGIHPNDAGHAAIATALLTVI